MPVLEFKAELNVDQLIALLAQLDAQEWARFEQRWETLRTQREQEDEAAWEQAAAFRFPAEVQARMDDLLARGNEGALTPDEQAKLRALAEETDQRNLSKAQALLQQAERKAPS